jgi:hypothetical protein
MPVRVRFKRTQYIFNVLYNFLQQIPSKRSTCSELAEVENLLRRAVETKALLLTLEKTPETAAGLQRDWQAALLAEQGRLLLVLSCLFGFLFFCFVIDVCLGPLFYTGLCLLLCQAGRSLEARPLLMAQGYTWRLSDHVLHYADLASATASAVGTGALAIATAGKSDDSTPVATAIAAAGTAPAIAPAPAPTATALTLNAGCLHAFDDVFSASVLDHLRHVFRPGSPFWAEHAYDLASNSSRKVGYFSYLYPLRERAAQNSIEQIVDLVFAVVQATAPQLAAECQMAEWWVHTRPHSSGHQLHFDSDETSLETGGAPQHPLLSTVVFVNNDLGGPTLITVW